MQATTGPKPEKSKKDDTEAITLGLYLHQIGERVRKIEEFLDKMPAKGKSKTVAPPWTSYEGA